jgi:hypothetical protein
LPYCPESVRKPNGVRCGKSSSRTKLRRRNSAWSIPRSSAAAWTIRSWKNIASVTRNEQRYATPPGALLVYMPRAVRWAAGMS